MQRQEYIDKYLLLPGIAMYFAGQWIVNLNYWDVINISHKGHWVLICRWHVKGFYLADL